MTKTSPSLEQSAAVADDPSSDRRCCGCDLFFGTKVDAIGYNYLVIARGFLIMSNIMLSTSLLWLASDAAGCFDDPDFEGPCTKRVYGILPSSFLTNIALYGGLVSAVIMPLAGAYVDFTPYRRKVGIVSAVLMTVVQAVQIYTVESTWFPMMILQGVNAVFYQIQNMAVYAYIPEIGRAVGEEDMTRITAHFVSNQFAGQALYLLVIGVIRVVASPSVVATGQISQALNTVTCVVFFGIGWLKYMSFRPAIRDLPEGQNMCTAGFHQIWTTAKTIHKRFRKGLFWFFLAICFARSSASAVTTLSVIFLQTGLGLDQTQVVVFFLCTMVGSVPGAQLGRLLTSRTDPLVSYKFSCVGIYVILIIGVFGLEGARTELSYLWGVAVGVGLGWFYAVENLFFAMVMPPGNETELSGFFVYCTQILVWFPPLVFLIMLENGVAQKYGWLVALVFLPMATVVLMFAAPWDEIVAEASTSMDAIRAERKAAAIGDGGEPVTAPAGIDDEAAA